MPRRRVHQPVGTMAGAATALMRSRPEDGASNLFVALGGGVGGCVASMLPDVLEPATCFNHRQFFHSIAAGAGGASAFSGDFLKHWEAYWRQVALEAQSKSVDLSKSPGERALQTVLAMVAWALVGFLAGVIAGYASHLALDLGDPSGLPLLGLRPSADAL